MLVPSDFSLSVNVIKSGVLFAILNICPLTVTMLWFLRLKRCSEFPIHEKEKEKVYFY